MAKKKTNLTSGSGKAAAAKRGPLENGSLLRAVMPVLSRLRLWHAVAAASVFIGALITLSSMNDPFIQLDLDDGPELQRVFNSGDPWCVLCSGGNESAAIVPESVAAAARRLQPAIKFARLDCTTRSKTMRGKSVMQRWGLTQNRDRLPVVFVTGAGGSPPVTQIESLAMSTEYDFVSKVRKAAKRKLMFVHTSAKLQQQCLARDECVLVLGGGTGLDSYHASALQKVMEQRRHMLFAHVDSSKFNLTIEKSLPSFKKGEPRLMYFRNNTASGGDGTLSAMAHRGSFADFEMGSFLDHIDNDASVLKTLPVRIALTPREKKKVVPAADFSADAAAANAAAANAAAAADDAEQQQQESGPTAEEREAARRAKMEEEQRSSAHFVEEGDFDGEDDEPTDEGEEEVEEL